MHVILEFRMLSFPDHDEFVCFIIVFMQQRSLRSVQTTSHISNCSNGAVTRVCAFFFMVLVM